MLNKKFEHTTKGTIVVVTAEAEKQITFKIAGTDEEQTIAKIAFIRWYKEVEETQVVEDIQMSDINQELETIFNKLNDVYYEGKLPKPMITVQSTPRAYGHCSVKKVWTAEGLEKYELNLGAEYINRPIENVAATINHEMVHLYCLENGIADTSQNGRYHNGKFKAEGEKRGLILEYSYDIGWSHTTPSEEFLAVLKEQGITKKIEIARSLPKGMKKTGSSDGSAPAAPVVPKKIRNKSHLFFCPCCGQSFRSTQDLKLKCAVCDEPMVRE